MKPNEAILGKKVRILTGHAKGRKATIIDITKGEQYPIMVDLNGHLGVLFFRYDEIEAWRKAKS